MNTESGLEDSLTLANTVLTMVSTVQPDIITIQCLITEQSLDCLLFKKVPASSYSKVFTRSEDISRTPNTCVAWKVRRSNFCRA